MSERLPDYKPAFQSLGKCTICYDNGKVCGNANDTQKIAYIRESDDFKPTMEQGRVEECIIFQQTKK